jgi:hypothetical protein
MHSTGSEAESKAREKNGKARHESSFKRKKIVAHPPSMLEASRRGGSGQFENPRAGAVRSSC